jgi:hypothetical protein
VADGLSEGKGITLRTPRDAVDAYLQGDLVLVDLLIELGRGLAREDATRFVASLPKHLLDEMVQQFDKFPQTEEGWSRLRVHRMGSWGRGVRRERVEAEQREEARLLRRSVELVRSVVTGFAGEAEGLEQGAMSDGEGGVARPFC